MGMLLAVVFHRVAALHDFPAQGGMALGLLPDAKEGDTSRVAIQQVQDLRRDDGVRTVVDRQGDFIAGRRGGRCGRGALPLHR